MIPVSALVIPNFPSPNEVAVAAFLENKISFLAISELNEHVVEEMTNILSPKYDDFVAIDLAAREITLQKISSL